MKNNNIQYFVWDIDNIKSVMLEIDSFIPCKMNKGKITISNGKAKIWIENHPKLGETLVKKEIDLKLIEQTLKNARVWEWDKEYFAPILDGESWAFTIKFKTGKREFTSQGTNAYPETFGIIYRLFESVG